MRIFRPCFIAGYLYRDALFRMQTSEKLLCLTFDDGPDPESSPELVKILNNYDVKAIFFCNGRSAEKYPDLVDMIKSNGHLIGNHGYDHLNGWRTSVKRYVADVDNGTKQVSSFLFRPPYGHLRLRQYRVLKKRYKIVFWDIMPYDFDNSMIPMDSFNILMTKIRPGSVIVLHDTPLSSFIPLLPVFIETVILQGYKFILPNAF